MTDTYCKYKVEFELFQQSECFFLVFSVLKQQYDVIVILTVKC